MSKMHDRVRLLTLAACVIVGATAATAGELRREVVASAHYGRDINTVVFVPDGYDKSGLKYPVLYLLHGANADENAWATNGKIQEKANRLIASGRIPPAIIVMPGCPSSWWVDGSKDKAESAFWNDVVPAIAERYRTIEGRRGSVVSGLSMGGFGAVRYALKYPDRFAAVAALSPAIYAEGVPANSNARINHPFLDQDNKFSQKLWDEQNYPSLLPGYQKQPIRVPFYLVSGDGDAFGIAFETALLFKRLFNIQPNQTEFRVVDGDHSWKVWEAVIDDAMAFMFQYTDKPQPVHPRTANSHGVMEKPKDKNGG